MGRLANISASDAAKAFVRAGWRREGQVGSYLVLTKPGVRVNLSVPQHRELSVGTLRALIRAAGMTLEEFLELL
jgi:predicted RNA binding protein YcfA (HicA-like mRNA interferase family)